MKSPHRLTGVVIAGATELVSRIGERIDIFSRASSVIVLIDGYLVTSLKNRREFQDEPVGILSIVYRNNIGTYREAYIHISSVSNEFASIGSLSAMGKLITPSPFFSSSGLRRCR